LNQYLDPKVIQNRHMHLALLLRAAPDHPPSAIGSIEMNVQIAEGEASGFQL
jgi:hypothetical protein